MSALRLLSYQVACNYEDKYAVLFIPFYVIFLFSIMSDAFYSKILLLGDPVFMGAVATVALAAATAYYLLTRPKPFKSIADYDTQSIELPVSSD